MSDFTVYEKMMCVERELRLRRMLRRKAVEYGGRITPKQADEGWTLETLAAKSEYQIKVMQAVADEYRSRWDGVVPNLNVDERFMV